MNTTKRHTAPPGYEHNHAAILDLLRFGPAIWSCTQMLALMFHAERSTAYGKDSDKHSEEQAMDGVYSVQQFAWVRGPAGLSRASWYRANSELEIDADEPKKKPLGVLRKNRQSGRYSVNEYQIDWLAVKAAIARWKEIQGSQRETPRLANKPRNAKFEGSQFETPQTQSRGLSVRPQGSQRETPAFTDSKGETEIEGSQRETHSQSPTKSDLNSRSDGDLETAIALELELACGQRPRTDGLARQILKAARKTDIPAFEIVARFIHEKATEFQRREYPFHCGTVAKAFCEEIIPWLRKNHLFVADCRRRRDLEHQSKQEVRQMATPEGRAAAEEQKRLLDEEVRREDAQFSRDLIADLQRKRKGASR